MKKFILLVVVVIAALGGWFYYRSHKSATPSVKVQPAVTKPDPSNATFGFDDGPITLKDGEASSTIAPNSAIELTTTLTDDMAYGDVNGDGKNDTAALLVQEGGGSGVFLYVAAYLSGVVEYKGSNAVFIGDRVSPKSISITNGVVNVTYLDRKPNEPYTADPTVSMTKHYIVQNGTLKEK